MAQIKIQKSRVLKFCIYYMSRDFIVYNNQKIIQNEAAVKELTKNITRKPLYWMNLYFQIIF